MIGKGARPRFRRRSACAVLLLLGGMAAGCGKKGPPLAPLRLVPEAPADVTLRRVADKALLRFTVPKKNVNGRGTVQLDHVDIYAITAAPGVLVPPDRELLTKEHVVGTIAVKPPPDEDAAPDPNARQDTRPSPGDAVTFTEELDAKALTPAQLPLPRPEKPKRGATSTPTAPPAAAAAPKVTYPVRIYVARGMTRQGRPGTPTPRLQLPIVPLPPPPADAVATFNETAVVLAWLPPVGDLTLASGVAAALVPVAPPAMGALGIGTADPSVTEGLPSPLPGTIASPTGAAAAPRPAVNAAATPEPAAAAPPPQPLTYNVYPKGATTPLNPAPLAGLSFDRSGAEYGKEQCFVIGTIAAVGTVSIESEPSAPVCITPRDIFAPAAPTGVAAVAGPGAINLIWNANTEPDIGGYLILRGEGTGDTLQPLTPAPIHETHYTDTTVKPGVHYVYIVVAVDKATPPNQSARTARVEETAR